MSSPEKQFEDFRVRSKPAHEKISIFQSHAALKCRGCDMPIGSGPVRSDSPENRLTYLVFTSLKNADRSCVLYSFFEQLGIISTKAQAEEAEFFFWTRYGEREPDCAILVNAKMLFVEAKLDSELDLPQLRDEYQEATKTGADPYLLVVTSHFSEPEEMKLLRNELRVDRSRIMWRGWKDFWHLFAGAIQDGLDAVSLRVLTDVSEVLSKLGFRSFKGLRVEEMKSMRHYTARISDLFNEISIFVRELEQRLQ